MTVKKLSNEDNGRRGCVARVSGVGVGGLTISITLGLCICLRFVLFTMLAHVHQAVEVGPIARAPILPLLRTCGPSPTIP